MATSVPFDLTSLLGTYDPKGKLESYHDLLMEQNEEVNLVSRETTRADFNRMVGECLLPLDQLGGRRFERYLDIGAGGGLPFVPVMIARVAAHGTATERTQKKARRLELICRSLDLKTTVLDQTVEDLQFDHRFDLITLRFVKLTEPLFKVISSLLAPGGVLIYYAAVPLKLKDFEITEFSFTTEAGQPPKFFSIISSRA